MQNRLMQILLDEYMETENPGDSADIQAAERDMKARLMEIDPFGIGVNSFYDDFIPRYYNAIIDQGFAWGFMCALALTGGRS